MPVGASDFSSPSDSCAAPAANSSTGSVAPLRANPEHRQADLTGGVRRHDRLGGLLHEYRRAA
jgi:hypothetical protein